jgi:hypothetical protein
MKQYEHCFRSRCSKKTVDITHVTNSNLLTGNFQMISFEWNNYGLDQTILPVSLVRLGHGLLVKYH